MLQNTNWCWQDYPEVESTNDTARELSHNPPHSKFVISAQKQTRGRGRRGRSWCGLDGNLFMSLAQPLEARLMGQLVFVVSLSLFQTLKEIAPSAPLKLKWPNDLLLDNHKISGILLEKGAGMYIITGIGVNICAAPASKAEVLYPAASLKDYGIETNRFEVLQSYLRWFDYYFELWQSQGFSLIREKWLQNVKGLHREIVVNLETESKNGIFEGIDEQGLLLLRTGGEIQKIYAGDVFYKNEKN